MRAEKFARGPDLLSCLLAGSAVVITSHVRDSCAISSPSWEQRQPRLGRPGPAQRAVMSGIASAWVAWGDELDRLAIARDEIR